MYFLSFLSLSFSSYTNLGKKSKEAIDDLSELNDSLDSK